jgi:MYXO-CTERM domain-containing protein
MRRACWAAAAVALGAMLVTPLVRANGRFPRAQQLIEDPDDPAHLIVRSTYGVLRTQDSGKSWFWICEDAVGYGGVEDPALGLTNTGTLLAGVFDGLSVSPDTGCNWSFPGPLANRYVVDLTVEQSDRSRALAMVSMGLGGGVFLNQLHRTTDGGATWTQLGPDLPDDVLGLTLDPAPSDPTRIYVSALDFAPDGGGAQGVLLRSSDGGATWTRLPISGTSLADSPFIAAIDPLDPERLYVRLSGPTEDSLLVSTDGGTSFQALIRKNAELYGFALAPDGKTVLAGFGNPRDGTTIDEAALGIWSASTTDHVFSHIYTEAVACLTWTPTRLYACTGQFDAGFELGSSSDGGKSFSSLMQLKDLQGPLECPATSTVSSVCAAKWQTTCETIGKCPYGSGGAAGSGSGGSGASSADSDGGCGCRAPGDRKRSGAALLIALALGFGLRKLLSGKRC